MAIHRHSSWPDKGGKIEKMFSGSAPPGPHTDLLRYSHEKVGVNKQIKGSAIQGQRHQNPPATRRT